MVKEEDLITTANRMAKKEKEYATSIKETAELFRHPLVKVLIEAISLDSEKHHLLFNALAQMLEQKMLGSVVEELLTLPKEEVDVVISMIHDHIRVEDEMTKAIRELAEKIEDEDIRTVLNYIYDDEVRHHKLLVDIEQKIISKYKEEKES